MKEIKENLLKKISIYIIVLQLIQVSLNFNKIFVIGYDYEYSDCFSKI